MGYGLNRNPWNLVVGMRGFEPHPPREAPVNISLVLHVLCPKINHRQSDTQRIKSGEAPGQDFHRSDR